MGWYTDYFIEPTDEGTAYYTELFLFLNYDKNVL